MSIHPVKAAGILGAAIVLLPSIRTVNAADTKPTATQAATPIFSPAAGATAICPDTQLHLAFPSAPALSATGKIHLFDADNNKEIDSIDTSARTRVQTISGLPNFNYYPVIISGNDVTIAFPNHTLAYHKRYYVTIDPGTFTINETPLSTLATPNTWTFTTKDAPPAADAAELTIAADGTGDFATVQGAIDFIPADNTMPRTLLIRKGIYNELIYVANKHGLTFLGEDRRQSVIQYANNNKFNSASDMHVYHRGVFLADHCNDLTLANLTIRNTTARGGSQAEAIIFNGAPQAHAIVTNVDLYSYQDTLQINGQAFINDSYIEGDVDFLWGTGPCFFENCELKSLRSKAYYTQIRNTAANHGYVFHHCTFDGAEGIIDDYLARIEPKRFPNSEVVLMDCTLTKAVGGKAWMLNNKKGEEAADTSNIHFWEFNSHDTAGDAVDTGERLEISRQLKAPDDASLIKDYSSPQFVLGGWSPKIPLDVAKQLQSK